VLHALALQHPALDRARSEWEAEVLRLARRFRMPEPAVNLPVIADGQRRVLDVAWSGPRVDLEFDGYSVHTIREVFDDDRVRQNALVAAGWTVFRVTARMLQAAPEATFAPIIAAVEQRGHVVSRMREVS
jgi:very-short-patch-repair endonuclease